MFDAFDANPFAGFAKLFSDPGSRYFVLYLATSLLAAWAIFRWHARRDPELEKEGVFGFLFPPEVWTHKGTRADIGLFILNKLVFAGVIGVAALFGTLAYGVMLKGVAVLPQPALLDGNSALATLLTTLIAVLFWDFGLWFQHYVMHRFPVLWEFHKVHHSAEVMTPFTAARTHPVDDLTGYLFSGFFSALGMACCRWLFGPEAGYFGFFETNIIVLVFYLFGFHLRHSHVWMPYTGLMGVIFVSPAHHQIHHSVAVEHWDRNMGFIFAFWDRMFGTLVVPRAEEQLRFGVNGFEEGDYDTVPKLLARPFVMAWKRLRGDTLPDYREMALAREAAGEPVPVRRDGDAGPSGRLHPAE
jgi:sterol desaturase/sphingolipid hydroxylase (fatty acid hydroxylase superfamily)